MIEVLFFNLLTTQICCHPRYTKGKTIGVLVLFSALFFGAFVSVSEAISFVGDGKWSLFGFIYLVPFRFLYKEKTPIIYYRLYLLDIFDGRFFTDYAVGSTHGD